MVKAASLVTREHAIAAILEGEMEQRQADANAALAPPTPLQQFALDVLRHCLSSILARFVTRGTLKKHIDDGTAPEWWPARVPVFRPHEDHFAANQVIIARIITSAVLYWREQIDAVVGDVRIYLVMRQIPRSTVAALCVSLRNILNGPPPPVLAPHSNPANEETLAQLMVNKVLAFASTTAAAAAAIFLVFDDEPFVHPLFRLCGSVCDT